MRFQKFIIKNFKGISELEINLSKFPNAKVYSFVGLNESGKTTILEALDWFKNPEDYDKHELIPKNQKANFNESVEVEAEIEFENDDLLFLKKYLHQNKISLVHELENKFTLTRKFTYKNSNFENHYFVTKYQLIGRCGKQKKEVDFSENNSEEWKNFQNILIQRTPPIVYYKDLYFDFPEKIFLTESQEKNKQEEIYREMIQDVLDSLDQKLRIKEHLVDRAKNGSTTELENIEAVLNLVGNQITDILKNTWGDIFKTKDNKLEITVGDNVSLDTESSRYYLTIKIKEGISKYQIKERSLGFRWFLAFVLFTHFRAYRAQQKNGLFLLDEPASNLHSTAQSKLLNEFENFPNNQIVIFSTHSHHMVNPNWLPTTYVVINNGMNYKNFNFEFKSSDTKIDAMIYHKFLGSYPNDTDYYRPILDALDYAPSKIEFVKDILFVEGKNDFHTLKFMSLMIDEQLKFGIAPFTGKDKISMMISFYVGWGKNFLVLFDDDKGGRQTRTKLIADFGPYLEERVFTLRNVHQDFKSFVMESLFHDEDKLKIINEKFPKQETYDKVKFNTALIEISFQEMKIPLHEKTIINFKILINWLNKQFDQINENNLDQ